MARIIGEHYGFTGEVSEWDGRAAKEELERLRRIHSVHPLTPWGSIATAEGEGVTRTTCVSAFRV